MYREGLGQLLASAKIKPLHKNKKRGGILRMFNLKTNDLTVVNSQTMIFIYKTTLSM